MRKTAFLFPGQGSQSVGMGADFYKEYDLVREIFDMAEEVCRESLSRFSFKGPMELLTQTATLQPALTAVNLSTLSVLIREGAGFDYTAGHSLGEYSAVSAAGILSAENALRIVRRRGELMQRESERFKGAMSAVVGLEIDLVREMTEAVNSQADSEMEGVYVANHNTETQIVVSGAPAAVKAFSTRAKEAGGRAIPLQVSGAWHSPLVRGAEQELDDFINGFDFVPAGKPVLFNVTAEPAISSDDVKNNLVNQLCSPVKWYDTINRLVTEGVDIFVEVGPGRVLSGLVKKIVSRERELKIYSVNDMKSLEICLKDLL